MATTAHNRNLWAVALTTLFLFCVGDTRAQVIAGQARQRVAAGETRPPRLPPRLQQRAQEIAELIRQRVLTRIQAVIEQEFGSVPSLQPEPVMLEALDDRNQSVEIPFNALARPLRKLDVPAYAARAFSLLDQEQLPLALYDTLPASVSPTDAKIYRRTYVGDAAQALAAEAKLVVSLKGGEWRESDGRHAVGNAVAVRGLDLDKGLLPNGNKTYDDSLFIVVDAPGKSTEVYEYRMTTESSSANRGVGRLNSMQVVYVRGLHRGKDPAYRLKGDAAEGTREGMEGTQRILGANMHSAYSRREIDSDTPLSPNVSLGCQVVAASKKDFEKALVTLLDGKGIKEFPYTIVDGDEIAVLDRALNERHKHSLLVGGIPRKAIG